MANLKRIVSALAVALVFSSCGTKVTPKIGKTKKDLAAAQSGNFEKTPFTGEITLTDGTVVDLSKEEKPIVLIFSTFNCQSCREEARSYSTNAQFVTKSSSPNLVRFITILSGSNREDAAKWKNEMGVKWEMGYEGGQELYDRYFCTATPCIRVQNRNVRKMLEVKAVTPLEDIVALTGPLYSDGVREIKRLTGKFKTIDDKEVDLETINESIVLMNLKGNCVECDKQVDVLTAEFKALNSFPRNIRFIGVMSGLNLVKSKAYVEKHGNFTSFAKMKWDVIADENGRISDQFCPEKKYPCVIVQNLGHSDNPIQKKTGNAISSKDLAENTGYWQYDVPVPSTSLLKGELKALDGSIIDLAKLQEPTVLIFATFLCGSCQKEAKAMSAFFTKRFFTRKGGIPKNVKIITVLADRDIEAAKKFAKLHRIKWTMAYDFGVGGDPKKKLIFDYCKGGETPCVYTQNTKNNPPVWMREFQSLDLNALEKETGPWVY